MVHGQPDHRSDKVEVRQVLQLVHAAVRVRLERVALLAGDEERVVRVEHLGRQHLEPLAREAAAVDALLALEGDAEGALEGGGVPAQAQEGVVEDVRAAHLDRRLHPPVSLLVALHARPEPRPLVVEVDAARVAEQRAQRRLEQLRVRLDQRVEQPLVPRRERLHGVAGGLLRLEGHGRGGARQSHRGAGGAVVEGHVALVDDRRLRQQRRVRADGQQRLVRAVRVDLVEGEERLDDRQHARRRVEVVAEDVVHRLHLSEVRAGGRPQRLQRVLELVVAGQACVLVVAPPHVAVGPLHPPAPAARHAAVGQADRSSVRRLLELEAVGERAVRRLEHDRRPAHVRHVLRLRPPLPLQLLEGHGRQRHVVGRARRVVVVVRHGGQRQRQPLQLHLHARRLGRHERAQRRRRRVRRRRVVPRHRLRHQRSVALQEGGRAAPRLLGHAQQLLKQPAHHDTARQPRRAHRVQRRQTRAQRRRRRVRRLQHAYHGAQRLVVREQGRGQPLRRRRFRGRGRGAAPLQRREALRSRLLRQALGVRVARGERRRLRRLVVLRRAVEARHQRLLARLAPRPQRLHARPCLLLRGHGRLLRRLRLDDRAQLLAHRLHQRHQRLRQLRARHERRRRVQAQQAEQHGAPRHLHAGVRVRRVGGKHRCVLLGRDVEEGRADGRQAHELSDRPQQHHGRHAARRRRRRRRPRGAREVRRCAVEGGADRVLGARRVCRRRADAALEHVQERREDGAAAGRVRGDGVQRVDEGPHPALVAQVRVRPRPAVAVEVEAPQQVRHARQLHELRAVLQRDARLRRARARGACAAAAAGAAGAAAASAHDDGVDVAVR
eukprot:Rhum_TRINITY_DN8057_c0_g1::Rhum_TRINITY_DN8057_c0_g1_i1::g.26044::m.26044